MNARNTDPETSHAAAAAFSKKASKVDARIIEQARTAGARGITEAEVVDAMPEYKPGSITPRFARLVRKGRLVRRLLGVGKPTKHFPAGRPIYVTRVDPKNGTRGPRALGARICPRTQGKQRQLRAAIGSANRAGTARLREDRGLR